MPMMPSPIAALAYGAVKVVGYAYFARYLNRRTGESVAPYKFGFAKTAIGFVGGLSYIFLLNSVGSAYNLSEFVLFLGAAPIRFLAWCVAISIFFQIRNRLLLLIAMAALGTVWSYVLDGVMWILFKILPEIIMFMPFC